MNKKLNIGLFGFGCVGEGFYDIFSKSRISDAEIKYICVRHHKKKRSLDENRFIYNKEIILNDPEIDLIIELISDADEAYEIVKAALIRGKKVISANKKMIALHLPELIELQALYDGNLLYEASTCGSIPVIRTLEDFFAFEEIKKIKGIFNGSSNFILSKINQEGLSYESALKEAQELGFAEADPLLDVGGFDALNKLCILVYHAFGVYVNPENILNLGIQDLHEDDDSFAIEKGWKLKQVAFATVSTSKKLEAYVLPQFVEEHEELFHIDQEFNALNVETSFAGSQLLKGKGAGSHPTGSAVFSDYKAIGSGYKYQYAKENQELKPDNQVILSIYASYDVEEDLTFLDFINVSEKGKTGQLNYQIGEITIDMLIKHRSALANSKIFIAAMPERVQNLSKNLALQEAAV